jgi:predicted DNA-binding protein
MVEKIDKARKAVALWAEDVTRLQNLSARTGRTQVELLHQAIKELDQNLRMRDVFLDEDDAESRR